MNAHDYLTLAEKLVETVKNRSPLCGGKGEAECRAAISRAYYAVYNSVWEFLDRIGFEPGKSNNNHQVLQDTLSNSGDSSLRTVGAALNRLHTERKAADYEMRNPRAEQMANAKS